MAIVTSLSHHWSSRVFAPRLNSTCDSCCHSHFSVPTGGSRRRENAGHPQQDRAHDRICSTYLRITLSFCCCAMFNGSLKQRGPHSVRGSSSKNSKPDEKRTDETEVLRWLGSRTGSIGEQLSGHPSSTAGQTNEDREAVLEGGRGARLADDWLLVQRSTTQGYIAKGRAGSKKQ